MTNRKNSGTLRVATTYEQARHVKRMFPLDRVVVVGANVFGERYIRIVDHTYDDGSMAPDVFRDRLQWWEHALNRLEDGGEFVAAGATWQADGER